MCTTKEGKTIQEVCKKYSKMTDVVLEDYAILDSFRASDMVRFEETDGTLRAEVTIP